MACVYAMINYIMSDNNTFSHIHIQHAPLGGQVSLRGFDQLKQAIQLMIASILNRFALI